MLDRVLVFLTGRADFPEGRQVLGRRCHCTSPQEIFVLFVTFAKLPCNLSPCQFNAQIEQVAGIVVQVQVRIEVERIRMNQFTVPIVQVNAVFGRLGFGNWGLSPGRQIRRFPPDYKGMGAARAASSTGRRCPLGEFHEPLRPA